MPSNNEQKNDLVPYTDAFDQLEYVGLRAIDFVYLIASIVLVMFIMGLLWV